MSKRIVAGKHAAAVALQDKTFVGVNNILEVEFADVQPFFRGIDAVYQSRVNPFEHFVRLFKYIHINDLVVDIVLAQQTDSCLLFTSRALSD